MDSTKTMKDKTTKRMSRTGLGTDEDRLNRWLMNTRVVFLIAALVAVPFVVLRAGHALSDRNNDIRQWLPNELAETRNYDWFLQHFGSEEFAIISWDQANLEDARVTTLSEHLRVRPEYFREVLNGPDAVAELQSGAMALTEQDARARLSGALIGRDGRTTAVLVRLSPAGLEDRHAAVAAIHEAAAAVGIAQSDLRLGGPTIESVTLDQESERSRYLLSGIALLLSSLAAWRCLRSITLMMTVLVFAMLCGAASLAWVSVFGDQMNMIMVTMPTLVYVLAISGAIHVTHYYQDSVNEIGREGALGRTFRSAWLPCVLTAVTTAIGLASLTVSHVLPVSLFGFYSALGVLTSLPVVLFLLPAVLSFLIYPQAQQRADSTGQGSHESRVHRGLMRVAEVAIGRHRLMAAAGLSALVFGAFGLTRLDTSVRIIDFFSPQSRIMSDYRWLEQKLGPLVPVEVIVQIPREHRMRMTHRVKLVEEIQEAMTELPSVDGIISAATYIPEPPPQRGLARLAGAAAMERKLQNARGELEDSGYLGSADENELWRISARVSALDDLDYGQFVQTLRSVVSPIVAEHNEGQAANDGRISVTYTGIVPLVYKAQRMLLNDLTTSFFSAFALIGVVMLVLMKGIRSGMLSMLPNTFPAIVVFGLMGWLGTSVDIGVMITASVAMGIAVDDTIHFMSWFRRGLKRGLNRHDAIREAFRRCGVAMLQTTAICGLGMVAFAFSGFGPTAGFATLMVTLLLAALVGDLLFLPALLAGPFGRVFESRGSDKSELVQPDSRSVNPVAAAAAPVCCVSANHRITAVPTQAAALPVAVTRQRQCVVEQRG